MKNFLDFSIKSLYNFNQNFNVIQYENLLVNHSENFWKSLGEKRALKLFHFTAECVPAYKDFLKINKIDPKKVKSILDFGLIPPTDKKNYIEKYPLRMRAINGSLNDVKIIASSSGTTGTPNYWPRGKYQEQEANLTHELLYKSLFKIDKYK